MKYAISSKQIMANILQILVDHFKVVDLVT